MRAMLHVFILLTFLTSLWSCSAPDKNTGSGNTRRSLDAYYIPSDVVKYLLPEVPNWANTSYSGSCHRLESIRYFDILEVNRSYNISYFDILQAQINFNLEKQNVLRLARMATDLTQAPSAGLPPRQEEILFYQAIDRSVAKFYSFKTPTFKRINVLWIDPFLVWSSGPGKLPTLKGSLAKTLLNHEWSKSGHPVIVSFCLTAVDLEALLEQEKITDHNIHVLGTGAMTPYRPDLSLGTGAKLYLDTFFAKDQEVHLYSRGKKWPLELEGSVNIHDF